MHPVDELLSSPAVSPHPTDSMPAAATLAASDTFVRRHVGPGAADIRAMLDAVGYDSLDELVDATVPAAIRLAEPLKIGEPRGEFELLQELRTMAGRNRVLRSMIGMGFSDTITPPVILRNVLENPGWYTQYTPYQAEIAQGRLEGLLNFQTMVSDLTGLPLANASLLDESTAAAEAMAMCKALAPGNRGKFLVARDCHPQTIAVVQARAHAIAVECVVADPTTATVDKDVCGVLVQYPTTDGRIVDYTDVVNRAHAAGALVVFAADILALTILKSPGEFGADIAVGSAQRFGVPMGFGGPHAAFMATKTEYARKMPGRIVGLSKDARGEPALRLALQTREQHIRRDKATSNICTAQALLANIAGLYAAYHGPHGLRRIAQRVHGLTRAMAAGLQRLGHDVGTGPFFDTLKVTLNGLTADAVIGAAEAVGYNLRRYDDADHVGLAFDETTTRDDVEAVLGAFAGGSTFRVSIDELSATGRRVAGRAGADQRGPRAPGLPPLPQRDGDAAVHLQAGRPRPVAGAQHDPAGQLHDEAERHERDAAGHVARVRPDAPVRPGRARRSATNNCSSNWSSGWPRSPASPPSLQPNAGSQGEYAGLLVIRAYHESRGDGKRNVCLIPTSAHGTNPASAVVAGLKVVAVACDEMGNVDVADLEKKAEQHAADLAALMVTYPSTHGVFEERIKEICDDRPPPRRAGLHGRGEHERPGRPVPPRRHRGRRLPPEPAQDVLHPPRRRRARHGPDRRRASSWCRSCPATPSPASAARRRSARSARPRTARPASSPSAGSTSP